MGATCQPLSGFGAEEVEDEADDESKHTMDPTVTLHIYDVGKSRVVRKANRMFRAIGTGAFHAAVEVYGPEYSYGACDKGPGIFRCHPKEAQQHQYRESIYMGQTSLTPQEVGVISAKMEREWQGPDYDLLRHNCTHFSDSFCVRLGVGNVPNWVVNLAGAGATLQDSLTKANSKAEVASIIAQAKANKIADKYRIKEKASRAADSCSGGVLTFSTMCCGAPRSKFFVQDGPQSYAPPPVMA